MTITSKLFEVDSMRVAPTTAHRSYGITLRAHALSFGGYGPQTQRPPPLPGGAARSSVMPS
jgi:hypothetical protein